MMLVLDRILFPWASVPKRCIDSLPPSVGWNLRLYIVLIGAATRAGLFDANWLSTPSLAADQACFFIIPSSEVSCRVSKKACCFMKTPNNC